MNIFNRNWPDVNTATMPEQLNPPTVFCIKRLHIELQVLLGSNRQVRVEPYQCKQDDLRLWSGIAKTQNVIAQLQLDQHKNADPLAILYALFQRTGWDVQNAKENRSTHSLENEKPEN